jgi:hypothetical protein
MRTIKLEEYRPSRVRLTRSEVEQLLATGLIGLTPLAGEGMYELRAGSQVGTVVLPSLRLLIRPKVGLENLFFLLGFGSGITRWTQAQFPYEHDPDLFRRLLGSSRPSLVALWYRGWSAATKLIPRP